MCSWNYVICICFIHLVICFYERCLYVLQVLIKRKSIQEVLLVSWLIPIKYLCTTRRLTRSAFGPIINNEINCAIASYEEGRVYNPEDEQIGYTRASCLFSLFLMLSSNLERNREIKRKIKSFKIFSPSQQFFENPTNIFIKNFYQ